MTEASLTVAVIDPSRARAAILEEGLRAAGIGRIVVIPDTADLQERVAALAPDVVVIHLESPSRDILEQMSAVTRQAERPVAMFVDRSDAAMMQAMQVPYTGDADVDFRTHMIPHHQGAIDMARVALQHARDPQTKAMAQKIIDDQEREIAEMRDWLKQRGR